jgi:rubrerythrin
MSNDYQAKVGTLSMEKALAVAAYGESVAAYRYRTLSEKTLAEPHRELFIEMADEEQGHHTRVQAVIKQHFAGSDFVLTPEDKQLVIVGPRMLEVTDAGSLERALEMIRASEGLTGRFYAALHDVTTRTELKPLLEEMADECFDHAKRLADIRPPD